jgi:predicted secreted hydrolase
VQFTVFRQATAPGPIDVAADPWSTAQLYLAHLAVTDVAGRRHVEAERLARGHPELAGARADPFAVWVDGWRLADPHAGFQSLELAARTEDMRVDLVLEPLKGPVLQGDRGLSAKGPDQASYYYSLPRLAVRGVVESGGERHRVEGRAWFDREWSTSLLSAGQAGWDWFGLHLDSGEDLMAFRLRRSDGRRDAFDQGAWIAPDGTSMALSASAFELQPLRWWHDADGVSWPVEWRMMVRLPDGERDFRVVAAIDDQRMDTLLTYWEGLVYLHDRDGRRIGAGYMELTGYD